MAAVTELHVNGTKHRIDADAARSLLSVLRDDLDLTGSKYGCGEGRCGACTVLIDGKATRSCVTSVGDCTGKPITTIEALERDGKLHPLQEAFLEAGAMQCGYCIPGHAHVRRGPAGQEPQANPAASRPVDGRQHLSLWHLRPHCLGSLQSGRDPERRWQMKPEVRPSATRSSKPPASACARCRWRRMGWSSRITESSYPRWFSPRRFR